MILDLLPNGAVRAAQVGIVPDPTFTGRERYTHRPSGRACVQQPFMSDNRFAEELHQFLDQAEAGELSAS